MWSRKAVIGVGTMREITPVTEVVHEVVFVTQRLLLLHESTPRSATSVELDIVSLIRKAWTSFHYKTTKFWKLQCIWNFLGKLGCDRCAKLRIRVRGNSHKENGLGKRTKSGLKRMQEANRSETE